MPVAQPPNEATVLALIDAAVVNNQTFLALPSPTQADVVAQVQALTRQVDGVLRFLTGQWDATT